MVMGHDYIVIDKNGEYEPYGAKCVDRDTATEVLAEAKKKDPDGGWAIERIINSPFPDEDVQDDLLSDGTNRMIAFEELRKSFSSRLDMAHDLGHQPDLNASEKEHVVGLLAVCKFIADIQVMETGNSELLNRYAAVERDLRDLFRAA